MKIMRKINLQFLADKPSSRTIVKIHKRRKTNDVHCSTSHSQMLIKFKNKFFSSVQTKTIIFSVMLIPMILKLTANRTIQISNVDWGNFGR
jgi:hypothetical protein